MEAGKRTRQDSKNYNERRNYNKRSKSGLESTKKVAPVNALIFDNGGYSIKIGYSKDKKPINLPNCIMKAKSERKRAFIADQIEDCRDLSGLFFVRPHERGYITKFDIQKNIWDYTFNKFPINDNIVMMTQPIFNFKTVQEFTDEIFFEEYDVKSLFKANPTDYAYYNYCKQFKVHGKSCLVIDTGFSFTYIVPYINGKKYAPGIIRMDIGGKLLTNYLKDIISYRQLHVMEETYVINQVKEDTCFMSTNFAADMHRAKTTNEIVKTYVLPDFHNIRRGYVQDADTNDLAENCQILRLNNERITVPEVMIRPSIINGLEVAGLAECISHAIKKCPLQYQKELSNNVVLTGGNSLFPGFRERLERETRIFLSCDYDLKIYQPEDSVNYAWLGGKTMSTDPILKSLYVSKQEYEEEGSGYTHNKFNQYCTLEENAPRLEPASTKSFSYLNYWKNEGVDIFQKEPQLPVTEPNVQFKLEGDNIEEFDGKYVTIEFEYEKTIEEMKTPEVEEEATYIIDTAPVNVAEDTSRLRRRKSIVQQVQQVQPQVVIQPQIVTVPMTMTTVTKTIPVTTATKTIATLVPKTIQSRSILLPSPSTSAGIQSTSIGQIGAPTYQTLTLANLSNLSNTLKPNQIVTFQPNLLNNVILPKLTRIQPKVYRPMFKPVTGALTTQSQTKLTQYISLGKTIGNTVNLSNALVSTSPSTTTTMATNRILNNAVILPQNLLGGKNLTFQIIPLKSEMMKQGNIIIAKKTQ